MRKRKDTTGPAFEAPEARPRITPMDIQQKEFRVSRMGGYKMRDVDEFLDQLTTSMTALVEENRRLQERSSGAGLGAPDLDAVARQADEIIARAREEAAAIVGDARSRTTAEAEVGNQAQDRVAITAFLMKERGFLQSLASLVQEHAEGVKGMAREARGSGAAPRTASPTPVAPPGAPETAEPVEPASVVEVAEPEDEPTPSVERPTESMEPVRVEEPEPAAVGRSEPEDGGEGDRSLRDLFWGEE